MDVTDKVRACGRDMQNVSENNSFGNAIIISATEANISSTDRNCREVAPKPFNRKGINRLVTIECRPIMEDMSVHGTVMITVVVLRKVLLEQREACNDKFITDVQRIRTFICKGETYKRFVVCRGDFFDDSGPGSIMTVCDHRSFWGGSLVFGVKWMALRGYVVSLRSLIER